MGITVAWGNAEQTFLLVTFEKPWTWEEFQTAIDQMRELIKDIPYRTHLLLDIRNAGFPPNGAVRRFQDVGDMHDPQIDLVIYIAPRILAHFIRSINSVMTAAFPKYSPPNFVFVQTLEEAHALMAEKAEKQLSA